MKTLLTKLQTRSPLLFALWCTLAAFGTYFCMYGFRKPFTASSYSGEVEKTALVTAQVFGYMLSKFIGVKVIAEMPPERRMPTLLLLICLAEGALVLFGVLPYPFSMIALFLNGLPLGMVFGLVLGALEGRRQTEALIAGLCASFILADGVTKTVGTWLLKDVGVPTQWMPAVAGLIYFLPLLLFAWMLSQIPPPLAADRAAREERVPMGGAERKAFFQKHAMGLLLITLAFLLLTVLRSVRSDFAPEIWKGLGQETTPAIFTQTETWVTLGIVALNCLIALIKDNKTAFQCGIITALFGFLLAGGAVLAQQSGAINGFTFMTLVGLGLYLPYVAVHTTLFERLIALTRDKGNIGFLMYFADSIGYLGYVLIMLLKSGKMIRSQTDNFTDNFLDFFRQGTLIVAVLGAVALALGGIATLRRVGSKSRL
jgi:hypothetical protein